MKGPGFDLGALTYDKPLDASFRVLSVYVPETDGIATRLDAKIGDQQFTVALSSGTPVLPQSGDRILGIGDLMTPAKGILECLNVKVSQPELIAALRELANDLESLGSK